MTVDHLVYAADRQWYCMDGCSDTLLKITIDVMPTRLINRTGKRWKTSTPGGHNLQGHVTPVMVVPRAISVRWLALLPLPR